MKIPLFAIPLTVGSPSYEYLNPYFSAEATSADKHKILGYQLFKDNYAKKMCVKVKSRVKYNVATSVRTAFAP